MPFTPHDLDERLRSAALATVRGILNASGGLITRAQMTAGFEFEGERIPFALQARGIWKPGRLGPSGAALSITTASVKPGIPPRYNDSNVSEDGWFQDKYQGTDPNAADNRAVRAAFELRKPVIYFYGEAPGHYQVIAPSYVVGDEPDALTFKVAADATGVGDPRLMIGGADAPLKAYATTTAKIRIHQRRFRRMVVAAYEESCAVCRLHHSELLDAAHILEDRDERGKPEVPNGLALCGVHHGAFDTNIMGIAPDRRIHIRRDILEEVDGPMLKHGLQEMHGSLIRVPSRRELHPKSEYLDERFARFLAA